MSDRRMLAERSVNCTGWRWLLRMRVFDESGRAHTIVGFEELDGSPILCDDETADIGHFDADELTPDFTDEPTVLAMLPLVRRAWTGHDLTITWHDSGNVDLVVGLYADGGARFWVRDVPLYAALTLALEAAPEKP